jgi:hypothetical protein
VDFSFSVFSILISLVPPDFGDDGGEDGEKFAGFGVE